MKNLLKKLFVGGLLLCTKDAIAQEKFDISASTDETNVLYVGLTNTIQFNVNHVPSEKLFVNFKDYNGNDLDTNVFKSRRILPNAYTLLIPQRTNHEIQAFIYVMGADTATLLGTKIFRIRSVPRPVLELGMIEQEKIWDYLMNMAELKVTMSGFIRNDIEYKIAGYKFIFIGKGSIYSVESPTNSLQPVKSLLERLKISKGDTGFFQFSEIRAVGPSGMVYLDAQSFSMMNEKTANKNLETLYAKKISQSFDFQKSLQNKLLQISLKIHTAGLAGKIQPFWDEALTKKCSRDSYAYVGSTIHWTQIAENNNSWDFKDTSYLVPLDEERMVSDFGFSYRVSSLKRGSLRKDILSIAPIYFEKINGITYTSATGWFPYNQLSTCLSVEDINFLESYSWFFESLRVSNLNSGDENLTKIEKLDKNKIITYGPLASASSGITDKFGEALQEYWRNKLYLNFQQNKFLLQTDSGQTISALDFKKLHTLQINTAAQDTAHPEDPTALIDYTYAKEPSSFDSIYFSNVGDKGYMHVKQNAGLTGTNRYEYKVALDTIKPLLDSKAYSMLNTLLIEQRQKMQNLKKK
jgi:hypothetical protein